MDKRFKLIIMYLRHAYEFLLGMYLTVDHAGESM